MNACISILTLDDFDSNHCKHSVVKAPWNHPWGGITGLQLLISESPGSPPIDHKLIGI